MDCVPTISSWLQYLSAALTPTIAILAALIGYQQWRTNQKRLKHELFDRRYAQFESVREFLGSIARNGNPTIEAQQNFLLGTRGMRFTFDEHISTYIHEAIWCTAIDIETLTAELQDLGVGEERKQKARERAESKKQLYKELQDLEKTFERYLQLSH